MLFSINLFLAEIDRPELLTRGFSNTYIVRALGLPAFLGYNANQTYNAHKNRSGASATDLEPVKQYITEHYAQPNDNYFGIAKGRNVIYLHLESLQQFVIDYKLNVNGVEHEVTPFLNSLYHSSSTLAFSNFFNQVKAGKTSDAETMIETSLLDSIKALSWSNMAEAIPNKLHHIFSLKMEDIHLLYSTVMQPVSGIGTTPINNGVTITSLINPISLKPLLKIHSNTV